MDDFENLVLEQFDYSLPEDCIAHYPVEPRDQSKLLVYGRHKDIKISKFAEIHHYLPSDAFLVFNDTKVIPARLIVPSLSGQSHVEIFLLEPNGNQDIQTVMQSYHRAEFKCLVGNKRRWKKEQSLVAKIGKNQDQDLTLDWLDRDNNHVVLKWEARKTLAEVLQDIGHVPLPPYIKRSDNKDDKIHYQTMYARHEGAVAAPTAGLHFTPQCFDNLKKKGIQTDYLTLHVGAGTFMPITVEKVIDHDMHAEKFDVSYETLKRVHNCLMTRKPIIGVGTTSVRVLETLYWLGAYHSVNKTQTSPSFLKKETAYDLTRTYGEQLPLASEALECLLEIYQNRPLKLSTQLMIMPGYDFKIIAGLITNFHQPKSTLLMLVEALIGQDWRKIYATAQENDFRFLSYGDSSLLIR